MQNTKISNNKIEAYEATHYRVGRGSSAFVLRIGDFSPSLKELYEAKDMSCAVFITASNPFGEAQGDDANELAQARLRNALVKLSPIVIAGAGADPTGTWPPEASYLALGIDEKTAGHLGRKFHQDAVIYTSIDVVPRLLLLR